MSTSKATVRTIASELVALPQVQELVKKYGLASVEYSGGVIDLDSFTVRVKFHNKVEMELGNGQTAPPASTRSMFGDKFAQHNLPNDIIGKTIKLGNRQFKIIDVKPQNGQGSLKKCVVLEGNGGGKYVTTAADVRRALGLAKPGTLTQVAPPFNLKKEEISSELCAKFEALSGRLSPENLSADGELNKLQVAQRRAQIMKEWGELEIQAGGRVSHELFPC